MLKLEDNPPMCPPSASTVAALQGDWWVAHTKPKCEKALAFDLLALEIGYYLPMAQRAYVSGGRKRRVMMPLFTSYLFFCGDLKQRYTALTTNRICRILPVNDRERFVAEISAVEAALSRNAFLEACPLPDVGCRCRVKAGPLQGVEGTVIRRDGRSMIALHLSMLGQGACLEIDASLLEPAG
jgi:transcriptional antiterminator RfaH